jgi:hypothetical protein
MEKNLSAEEGIVLPSKFQRLIQKLLAWFKFLLGLLLLPFVYSSTRVFLDGVFVLESNLKTGFFLGIAVFLLIYLFIWEPTMIYKKGQRFVQIIFGFFSPLVKVAPYLLPIYTIFSFLIYFLLSIIFKPQQILDCFMFLFGLTVVLHLVFSARSLRSRASDYLKADYLFGFSFIWLINIIILSFGFNLILKEYSFVNFLNQAFKIGITIYRIIFKQLFL